MLTELTIEDEQKLIKLAKNGDNQATKTLLTQYGPALKAASNRNFLALDQNERDSVCHTAFVEALNDFNPAKHSRLAGVIKNSLKKEFAYERSTSEVLSIPERTISRFNLIMSKADQDVFKALEIAPKNDMSTDTFLTIWKVTKDSARLDEIVSDSLETTPLTNSSDEAPEAAKRQVMAVFEVKDDGYDLSPIEVQVLSVHFGLAGNCNSESKGFAETAFELDMPLKDVRTHYKSAIAKAQLRLGHGN